MALRTRPADGPLARRRALGLVAALALTLVAATGCSDDGSDNAGGSSGEGTTEEAGTPSAAEDADDADADAAGAPVQDEPPEQFSGPDEDFYVVPDPLPEGEPGELIRVQELGEADGQRSVRVMYHSRDAQDADRAVTGVITFPTGEAPEDGWPVTSWAHGTTGLAAPCAPSRWLTSAPDFGVEGVLAATDYVGLGPVGEVHPYLSKPSEGNAVIDIVRAARVLPDAHAGEQWISIGHSQGGHGSLSAHELADEHAPELELVGTVSWAPASDFTRTFGGIDDIVARIVGTMGLYGAAAEHPEIDPDDYVSPEVAAQAEVITGQCLDQVQEVLVPYAVTAPYWAEDPTATAPARDVLAANEVGDVAVDAPLLLVSGTADDRVVIDRVRSLFDRLCMAGQVTELVVVEGATHGDIIPKTQDQVTAWMEARLAGDDPVDSCEEDGS